MTWCIANANPEARPRRGHLSLGGVLLLLVVTLSSCVGPPPRGRGGAPTPEEAVRRVQIGPRGGLLQPAPAMRVHLTRPVAEGVVVIYSLDQQAEPGPPPPPGLGYALAVLEPDGWYVRGTTYGAGVPAPDARVVYRSSPLQLGADGGWIVYGRTLVGEVASVEVLLDDGQTVRDAVGNEAFAVIAPTGTIACEVRVLDVQGAVIERRDPAREFDAPPDAPQWKQRCGKQ